MVDEVVTTAIVYVAVGGEVVVIMDVVMELGVQYRFG